MPVTTSPGVGLATPSTARLSDMSGQIEPVQPEGVGRQLAAGAFVWLDLENPDANQLQAFGETLGLDHGTLKTLTTVAQRPSFAAVGDSTQAVVPSMTSAGSASEILGIRFVFTNRFLLTTHTVPCPGLQSASLSYRDLRDDKKNDGTFVLFLVLNEIMDAFIPDLVNLDRSLDRIQVTLLGGSPPGAQQEIIEIRRPLSEAIQALGLYVGDLSRNVGSASQLPGMGPGAERLLDQHRSSVVGLIDSAKDYRDETQDALGQLASNVSAQQGELINVLTVVATIFLPLTFLTGYFGQNFGVITMDLNAFWVFVLLGLLLPAASVVATFVVLQRLSSRMGAQPFLPWRSTPQATPPGSVQPSA